MITVQCFDARTRLAIATFKMPITDGKIKVAALERALNASALLLDDPEIGPVLILSDSSDCSICSFAPGSVVKIHRLLVRSDSNKTD
jgi:hypothetical protein